MPEWWLLPYSVTDLHVWNTTNCVKKVFLIKLRNIVHAFLSVARKRVSTLR